MFDTRFTYVDWMLACALKTDCVVMRWVTSTIPLEADNIGSKADNVGFRADIVGFRADIVGFRADIVGSVLSFKSASGNTRGL